MFTLRCLHVTLFCIAVFLAAIACETAPMPSTNPPMPAFGVRTGALSACPYKSYLCGNDGLAGLASNLYWCGAKGQPPTLVAACPAGCVIVNNANDKCGSASTDGWSSQTGYNSVAGTVLGQIVQGIVAGPSLQSIVGDNPTWQPDTSGGDGQRMRAAAQDLHSWYGQQGKKPTLPLASIPPALRALMASRLADSYGSDTDALVARIVYTYSGCAPPTTDNGTLVWLGLRAQCKEFADRMVRAGGGKSKAYTPTAVAAKDVRAGMYAFLYTNDKPKHAAIIVDVEWVAGAPSTLRLGEANWGSGWSNPPGQAPWNRAVSTSRVVPYGAYVVASSL